MSQGFVGILERLVGPPGGMILLILVGFLLLSRHQRVAKGLIIIGLVLLYVLSLPITTNAILRIAETPVSISKEDLQTPRAQAIVVLGWGRRENTADFDFNDKQGDTASAHGLERIRYAAWLAKHTQLPILASGGLADEDGPAESLIMKQVLEQELYRPVKWTETRSRNTFENAQLSSVILKKAGISRVYLVTHALHMKRAKWSFEQQNILVIPAPTAFMGEKNMTINMQSFLPSTTTLSRTSLIFHELTGNIWYRLRY